MNCPECGAWSDVIETRKSKVFGHRRRRECANGHKFTTQEIVIPEGTIKQQQRENLATANKKRMVAVRSSGRETTATATQTTQPQHI